MNLALYGAAGMLGSRIAKEALDRGHSVTALVRTLGKLALKHENLVKIQADATDATDIAKQVKGHDAVICAIGSHDANGPETLKKAAHALIKGLKEAGVLRLMWCGGAGSLEIAPGQLIIDQPWFPAAWLPAARAQQECLNILKSETELEWSYASPAALLEPGERKGKFKLGGDQWVVDKNGESKISAEDLAFAIVYQLERHGKIRQRFTLGYVE